MPQTYNEHYRLSIGMAASDDEHYGEEQDRQAERRINEERDKDILAAFRKIDKIIAELNERWDK